MAPTGLPGSLPAGPFTTADAGRQGVSRGVLAGNRIDAVLHGVHAVSVAALFSERDRMHRLLVAAHLVVPDVVASCMTACVLWGLPVPSRPGRIHVCSSRQVRRPEVLVHRRTVDDRTDLDCIAVTTLVQTFIDVGLEVEASWHLAIGDAIVGRGLLTAGGLRAGLLTRPATRGIAVARRTATLVRAGSESPMESLLRAAILAAGLPEPTINSRVLDESGGWLARVDLAYPDRRIAIEYQGDHHRSDRRQWRGDVGRTRALQAARRDDIHRRRPGRSGLASRFPLMTRACARIRFVRASATRIRAQAGAAT